MHAERQNFKPTAKRSTIKPKNQAKPQPSASHDSSLVCIKCGHHITKPELAISVATQHSHMRINPLGIEYEFGCFRAAAGCRQIGEQIHKHSWFSGHSWQITLCVACHTHLGWYFSNDIRSFFALIHNRLAQISDLGPDSEPHSRRH